MTSESFWYDKPQMLLEYPYVYNILPNNQESFISQLNALSRFVILVSFIAMIIMPNKKTNVLITLCITLGAIIIFEKNNKQKIEGICNIENKINSNVVQMKQQSTNEHVKQCSSDKSIPQINVKSNVDSKLFRNLNDEIDYENFERKFNILPDTSVSAQNAFIKYCFKNTASEKDKQYATYK